VLGFRFLFFDMINMIDMIVVPRMARRKNLECGDKSRAVRGSRHRFLSALCAERTLSPHTLSRLHLVSTLSRLRQRRSVLDNEVWGRSVPRGIAFAHHPAAALLIKKRRRAEYRLPPHSRFLRLACECRNGHKTRTRLAWPLSPTELRSVFRG
jgi:hypothetical protein